jgi:hypothetical protein
MAAQTTGIVRLVRGPVAHMVVLSGQQGGFSDNKTAERYADVPK